MGLFGLTTAEAIIIAQREKDAEENRRHKDDLNFRYEQIEETKKQNKKLLKAEYEKVSEINREARQLEPFIILTDFDNGWQGETISIRPSDIKVMKGKVEENKIYDYDHRVPGGYYYETKRKPYTELQLWDGRKIKVKESVQDIQNKVNETIEKMVDLQAKTLNRIINQ